MRSATVCTLATHALAAEPDPIVASGVVSTGIDSRFWADRAAARMHDRRADEPLGHAAPRGAVASFVLIHA